MVYRAVDGKEMGYGIFSAIIHRRTVGNIRLIVLQPIGYRTLIVCHLTAQHSNIPTIVHYVMPIVFQQLLRLHILSIDH